MDKRRDLVVGMGEVEVSKPDEIIYACDLDGTGSAHPCSKEDHDAYEYIRADVAKPRVKKLMWVESRGFMTAETKFGTYLIEAKGSWGFGLWSPSLDADCDPDGGYFETIGAAQESAQADFEDRVRECLE